MANRASDAQSSGAEFAAIAFAGILGAAGVLALSGFTVDDALVAPRVAWRLARGEGYRFNASGPAVDAVTPLGWAFLLVPWAGRGPLAAFAAARWIGACCWVGAAAWLGSAVWRAGRRWVRLTPLLFLAACAPLGAWAVSGMETGTVTLLATLALSGSRWAPLAAGWAAAWRPELIPWALVLTVGSSLVGRRGPSRTAVAVACALVPSLIVLVVRAEWFSSPTPLAVVAKPSDLEHGVSYACRALIWSGPPVLLAAPRALRSLPAQQRVIVVALLVHLGALVLAGGDWMALFRLFVPVLPGALLVGASVAERAPAWHTLVRGALGLGVCALVWLSTGMAARTVLSDRLKLIQQAKHVLAGSRSIAALDVGWVGAATDADIVDLAGVTDPRIAVLPGGHTSKRVPASVITGRNVDAAVLLLAPGQQLTEPWQDSGFERVVERRVARLCEDVGFRPAAQLERLRDGRAYVVVKEGPVTGAED